jgi:iron-sulfur cluster repair protein YtfE (RIC family)
MSIDPEVTVNQFIQRHPAALALLTAAGIDTCCGGGLSLEDAAEGAGVALADLVRGLESGAPIADAAAASCGCGCKGS